MGSLLRTGPVVEECHTQWVVGTQQEEDRQGREHRKPVVALAVDSSVEAEDSFVDRSSEAAWARVAEGRLERCLAVRRNSAVGLRGSRCPAEVGCPDQRQVEVRSLEHHRLAVAVLGSLGQRPEGSLEHHRERCLAVALGSLEHHLEHRQAVVLGSLDLLELVAS